jgi:hypothetical protein
VYGKAILEKVQYVRSKQWRKTFIFVHGKALSQSLSRSLKNEGVVHLTLIQFRDWIGTLERTLEAISHMAHSESNTRRDSANVR